MINEENKVNADSIDLGSYPNEDDFNPFDDASDLENDTKVDMSAQQQIKPATPPAASAKTDNPLESAIDEVETKEAEAAQQSLTEKPPVFEYAGATEDITDTSKTFEELRIEKASDFPELEDGKRVSWFVEYGKVTKNVSDPNNTSIAKMKTDIEMSKEFMDALKKSKDKNPACKLKPRVTAQSKGIISAYKGIFTTVEEAETAGKVISIVPGKDGKVYEIRNTNMGKFITQTGDCDILSEVRAGFIPSLQAAPCA